MGLYQAPGSPTSWRQFTGNMVPNLESGESNTNMVGNLDSSEYLSASNALMQMGGAHQRGQNVNGVEGEPQLWPTMVFDPSFA